MTDRTPEMDLHTFKPQFHVHGVHVEALSRSVGILEVLKFVRVHSPLSAVQRKQSYAEDFRFPKMSVIYPYQSAYLRNATLAIDKGMEDLRIVGASIATRGLSRSILPGIIILALKHLSGISAFLIL